MFNKEVYLNRRNKLKNQLSGGVLLFLGNSDVPFNYPANTFHFRQDSTFLYLFGLDLPGFAGIIDLDSGEDILFGNDIDMDDIIWMGFQPSVKDFAAKTGIVITHAYDKLADYLIMVQQQNRRIHYVNPYRSEIKIQLEKLINVPVSQQKENQSEALIKALVSLREIKEHIEIEEIESALGTAFLMHTTAMRMANSGVPEQEIAGYIEGIALANGGPVSFPVILSMDGQILHNHNHNAILANGRLLVVDAGCETKRHYASDITRTTPVDRKFSQQQREIYQAVLDANLKAIEMCKPDIAYKQIHLAAAHSIAQSLKDIGLMKGNIEDAVNQGAHALFFPHGLGHPMGLDVHDMENYGENFVGYNNTIERSKQFGLAFLRFGKPLKKGMVMTIEPGCYFIPALIDQWKSENKFSEYINYPLVETYKNFGGIRIEDDVVITDGGCRVLGIPIPKEILEIENILA